MSMSFTMMTLLTMKEMSLTMSFLCSKSSFMPFVVYSSSVYKSLPPGSHLNGLLILPAFFIATIYFSEYLRRYIEKEG